MTDTVQVPREATEGMLSVNVNPPLMIGHESNSRIQAWRKKLYSAMLAAAPQATDPRKRHILITPDRSHVEVRDMDHAMTLLAEQNIAIENLLATDPRDAEIERLKGELILAKASAEAAGSLLLDVQKDCIAERQGRLAAESRIATLTAERDESIRGHDSCKTTCDRLRDMLAAAETERDALREAVEFCPRCKMRNDDWFLCRDAGCFMKPRAFTTQPSKTETRDDE